MYNYHPGELDQRIAIKQEITAPDGQGGQVVTGYSTVLECWAKVTAKPGRENPKENGRVNASGAATFVIRNRPDLSINETLVIDWGGVFYNVVSCPNNGARFMYAEIEATRGGVI